jgi:hypothetical protein
MKIEGRVGRRRNYSSNENPEICYHLVGDMLWIWEVSVKGKYAYLMRTACGY